MLAACEWRWGELAAYGWRWGELAAYGWSRGTCSESLLYRFNR